LIRKILLAAVLTCGITTTYAAERPSEFAYLSTTDLATACAVQLVRYAAETQKGTAYIEPKKTETVRTLLQLHLVWARIANADEDKIAKISKQLYPQSAKDRLAVDNYCLKEGTDMYRVLSSEGQNRIYSKALDLQLELFQ
jgi:hypothetical protein